MNLLDLFSMMPTGQTQAQGGQQYPQYFYPAENLARRIPGAPRTTWMDGARETDRSIFQNIGGLQALPYLFEQANFPSAPQRPSNDHYGIGQGFVPIGAGFGSGGSQFGNLISMLMGY